eukprot:gene4647-116_t
MSGDQPPMPDASAEAEEDSLPTLIEKLAKRQVKVSSAEIGCAAPTALSAVYALLLRLMDKADQLRQVPWASVDAAAIELFVAKAEDDAAAVTGDLPRRIDTVHHVEDFLRDWRKHLVLIRELQEPCFTQEYPPYPPPKNPATQKKTPHVAPAKYWGVLEDLLGTPAHGVLGRPAFILGDLLAVDPITNLEHFTLVHTAALRESSYANVLEKLGAAWQDKQLKAVPVGENQDLVLDTAKAAALQAEAQEGSQSLRSMLQTDHLLILPSLRSRYTLEADRLDQTRSMIADLLKMQAKWTHLSMFRTLGIDLMVTTNEEFDSLQEDMLAILQEVTQQALLPAAGFCMDAASGLCEALSQISSAITMLLESKRYVCPRLYFLPDPVLLEMLGDGFTLERMQEHVSVLFAGVNSLNFSRGEDGPIITSLSSTDGEILTLHPAVTAQGSLEEWVGSLDTAMKREVHELVSLCAERCMDRAGGKDLFLSSLDDLPLQLGLVSVNLLFTLWAEYSLGVDPPQGDDRVTFDVYEAPHSPDAQSPKPTHSLRSVRPQSAMPFGRTTKASVKQRPMSASTKRSLSTGLTTLPGPAARCRETAEQLSAITSQLQQHLRHHITAVNRRKVETVLATHVANVSVWEDEVTPEKTCTVDDWVWRKQFRFYPSPSGGISIKAGSVCIDYGHEYLGSKASDFPCLRAHRVAQLMALHSFYPPSPGRAQPVLMTAPASMQQSSHECLTGLSHLLGRMHCTFLCEDDTPSAAILAWIAGLAATGSHGTLFEITVLPHSVQMQLADAVQSLFTSLSGWKREYECQGLMRPITPGFALSSGSICEVTDLKRNLLKSVMQKFRQLTLPRIHPQSLFMSRLAAVGFTDFKLLSGKLNLLVQLCETSFGLALFDLVAKFVDAIGRAAVCFKNRNTAFEDLVLSHAVVDILVPTMSYADSMAFQSLVQLVFGTNKLRQTLHVDFDLALDGIVQRHSLLQHPPWLDRLHQVYQELSADKALSLLGPSLSGKSTTFAVALEVQTHIMGCKHSIIRISPRSTPYEDIVGSYDDEGFWEDGSLTQVLRSENAQRKTKSFRSSPSRATQHAQDRQKPVDAVIWLVFDGRMDDDSIAPFMGFLEEPRHLALPTGEELPVPATFRVCLETDSVVGLSPAVLANLSLVHFDHNTIAWKPALMNLLHQSGPVFSATALDTILHLFDQHMEKAYGKFQQVLEHSPRPWYDCQGPAFVPPIAQLARSVGLMVEASFAHANAHTKIVQASSSVIFTVLSDETILENVFWTSLTWACVGLLPWGWMETDVGTGVCAWIADVVPQEIRTSVHQATRLGDAGVAEAIYVPYIHQSVSAINWKWMSLYDLAESATVPRATVGLPFTLTPELACLNYWVRALSLPTHNLKTAPVLLFGGQPAGKSALLHSLMQAVSESTLLSIGTAQHALQTLRVSPGTFLVIDELHFGNGTQHLDDSAQCVDALLPGMLCDALSGALEFVQHFTTESRHLSQLTSSSPSPRSVAIAAGRPNSLPARLLGRAVTLYVPPPCKLSLRKICHTALSTHFVSPPFVAALCHPDLLSMLCNATVKVYAQMTKAFSCISLHNMALVLAGLRTPQPASLGTEVDLISLWTHEMVLLLCDRVMDYDPQDQFEQWLKDALGMKEQEELSLSDNSVWLHRPEGSSLAYELAGKAGDAQSLLESVLSAHNKGSPVSPMSFSFHQYSVSNVLRLCHSLVLSPSNHVLVGGPPLSFDRKATVHMGALMLGWQAIFTESNTVQSILQDLGELVQAGNSTPTVYVLTDECLPCFGTTFLQFIATLFLNGTKGVHAVLNLPYSTELPDIHVVICLDWPGSLHASLSAAWPTVLSRGPVCLLHRYTVPEGVAFIQSELPHTGLPLDDSWTDTWELAASLHHAASHLLTTECNVFIRTNDLATAASCVHFPLHVLRHFLSVFQQMHCMQMLMMSSRVELSEMQCSVASNARHALSEEKVRANELYQSVKNILAEDSVEQLAKKVLAAIGDVQAKVIAKFPLPEDKPSILAVVYSYTGSDSDAAVFDDMNAACHQYKSLDDSVSAASLLYMVASQKSDFEAALATPWTEEQPHDSGDVVVWLSDQAQEHRTDLNTKLNSQCEAFSSPEAALAHFFSLPDHLSKCIVHTLPSLVTKALRDISQHQSLHESKTDPLRVTPKVEELMFSAACLTYGPAFPPAFRNRVRQVFAEVLGLDLAPVATVPPFTDLNDRSISTSLQPLYADQFFLHQQVLWWVQQGLPGDQALLENAWSTENTPKCPAFIDPHGIAMHWVQNREKGPGLMVVGATAGTGALEQMLKDCATTNKPLAIVIERSSDWTEAWSAIRPHVQQSSVRFVARSMRLYLFSASAPAPFVYSQANVLDFSLGMDTLRNAFAFHMVCQQQSPLLTQLSDMFSTHSLASQLCSEGDEQVIHAIECATNTVAEPQEPDTDGKAVYLDRILGYCSSVSDGVTENDANKDSLDTVSKDLSLLLAQFYSFLKQSDALSRTCALSFRMAEHFLSSSTQQLLPTDLTSATQSTSLLQQFKIFMEDALSSSSPVNAVSRLQSNLKPTPKSKRGKPTPKAAPPQTNSCPEGTPRRRAFLGLVFAYMVRALPDEPDCFNYIMLLCACLAVQDNAIPWEALPLVLQGPVHWGHQEKLCAPCGESVVGTDSISFSSGLFHSKCVPCHTCNEPIKGNLVDIQSFPFHPGCETARSSAPRPNTVSRGTATVLGQLAKHLPDVFHSIPSSLATKPNLWKQSLENFTTSTEFPDLPNIKPFYRLLISSLLRPDQVPCMASFFIGHALGNVLTVQLVQHGVFGSFSSPMAEAAIAGAQKTDAVGKGVPSGAFGLASQSNVISRVAAEQAPEIPVMVYLEPGPDPYETLVSAGQKRRPPRDVVAHTSDLITLLGSRSVLEAEVAVMQALEHAIDQGEWMVLRNAQVLPGGGQEFLARLCDAAASLLKRKHNIISCIRPGTAGGVLSLVVSTPIVQESKARPPKAALKKPSKKGTRKSPAKRSILARNQPLAPNFRLWVLGTSDLTIPAAVLNTSSVIHLQPFSVQDCIIHLYQLTGLDDGSFADLKSPILRSLVFSTAWVCSNLLQRLTLYADVTKPHGQAELRHTVQQIFLSVKDLILHRSTGLIAQQTADEDVLSESAMEHSLPKFSPMRPGTAGSKTASRLPWRSNDELIDYAEVQWWVMNLLIHSPWYYPSLHMNSVTFTLTQTWLHAGAVHPGLQFYPGYTSPTLDNFGGHLAAAKAFPSWDAPSVLGLDMADEFTLMKWHTNALQKQGRAFLLHLSPFCSPLPDQPTVDAPAFLAYLEGLVSLLPHDTLVRNVSLCTSATCFQDAYVAQDALELSALHSVASRCLNNVIQLIRSISEGPAHDNEKQPENEAWSAMHALLHGKPPAVMLANSWPAGILAKYSQSSVTCRFFTYAIFCLLISAKPSCSPAYYIMLLPWLRDMYSPLWLLFQLVHPHSRVCP